MKIGELIYSLGAEWDKGSLDSIKSGFESVSKSFLTSVGLASTALVGVFAVVQQFSTANDELGKLARNRDMAIDTLQSLEYSFKLAGLSASQVGDVFSKLQEQREGFLYGRADYYALDRLGIDPTAFKTNEDFFNTIIDGLNKVKDESLKSDLSKRLLGSSDMKNLIDGGTKALREQKKELAEMGVLLTNQDYETSAQFNDTLLKTLTILKGMVNKVTIEVIPILNQLLDQFYLFLKVNRDFIYSGLKTFFRVIIDSTQFFISLLGRVIEHLGGIKVVAAVITGLFIIWQLPLIATIAIVIALMLVFDDLMNYFEGNDSVIADWIGSITGAYKKFVDEFPNLSKPIEFLVNNTIAMITTMKDVLFNLWDLITGKLSFKEAFDQNIELVKNLITVLKDQFLAFAEYLKTQAFSFLPSWMSGYFSQATPAMQTAQTAQSTSTNNYYITANVDAKNKTVGEAIFEISQSGGY